MKLAKGETPILSERQAFGVSCKRQLARGLGATVGVLAGAFITAIAAMPKKKSHERSAAERERTRFYLGRLLIFAIAVAVAQVTSARAETCIQGVHDCIKTQTTPEGGFDPKNPWFQKHPTPEVLRRSFELISTTFSRPVSLLTDYMHQQAEIPATSELTYVSRPRSGLSILRRVQVLA